MNKDKIKTNEFVNKLYSYAIQDKILLEKMSSHLYDNFFADLSYYITDVLKHQPKHNIVKSLEQMNNIFNEYSSIISVKKREVDQ